jgi:hypothetical protein
VSEDAEIELGTVNVCIGSHRGTGYYYFTIKLQ